MYVKTEPRMIEFNSWLSISVFISDVNIKQGSAIFMVNLVTKSIGYSKFHLDHIKPTKPNEKTGKSIFKTAKNNNIMIKLQKTLTN